MSLGNFCLLFALYCNVPCGNPGMFCKHFHFILKMLSSPHTTLGWKDTSILAPKKKRKKVRKATYLKTALKKKKKAKKPCRHFSLEYWWLSSIVLDGYHCKSFSGLLFISACFLVPRNSSWCSCTVKLLEVTAMSLGCGSSEGSPSLVTPDRL